MEYQYYLIDAFTCNRYQGAQIAVFPDAGGIPDQHMQLLARELNLSESVFICPATDNSSDYRLRIFTPWQEVDFAGHPLVAAGYVLQRVRGAGNVALRIQLNRESMDLQLDRDDQGARIRFSLAADYRLDDFVPTARELGDILHLEAEAIDQSGLRPLLVSCNGDYLLVPVKSADVFSAAHFNIHKWTTSFVATLATQIILLHKQDHVSGLLHYRVRLLGKHVSEQEDPPVGSVAPAVGVYLFQGEPAGRYDAVLQRGGNGKRKSMIDVIVEKTAKQIDRIHVGGYAVQTGYGALMID